MLTNGLMVKTCQDPGLATVGPDHSSDPRPLWERALRPGAQRLGKSLTTGQLSYFSSLANCPPERRVMA